MFAWLAPPGAQNIPLLIGSIVLAITGISAIAAWSARETYRVRLADLGDRGALPLHEPDYTYQRAQGGPRGAG